MKGNEPIKINSNEYFLDAGAIDRSRPKERPSKTNLKKELLKLILRILQYPFPDMVTRQVWDEFRKPLRAPLNIKQELLIEKATIHYTNYKGCRIAHFRWGNSSKKILLSHGWNSKIADFRKMIEHLVLSGYQVEGLDIKGHGLSEGDRSALPEILQLLSEKHKENGPFHAIIGYSIGGLGAGLLCASLSTSLQPKHLIMIASPPYTSYFFESTIREHGFRPAIYHGLCKAIELAYGEPISAYDIRSKQIELQHLNHVLIYDENDQTVPFEKGLELKQLYPHSTFIHTKGLGHYKIITHHDVLELILNQINSADSQHLGD